MDQHWYIKFCLDYQELIERAREQATPIKWQNPNMADTIIFIYGISVMFVDVITSDMPIIIDNDVIACPYMDV